MSASRVAVVGAGIAGLAAATELSERHRVTVLDRLPVAGGALGVQASAIRELERSARSAGLVWLLGTTAIRWQQRRLLSVGPDGIRWLDFEHLVYAGGTRPSTQAELKIAGPRLAGVLPATVAVHFAEAGVLLGHRVVIVGTGDWAHAAAHAIAGHACEITVVSPAGDVPSFRHDALISGWSPAREDGRGRVAELILERLGVEHRLSCDAVILAASQRPLRNVDGAVLETSQDVTFIQPMIELAAPARTAQEARAAAASLVIESLSEVTV